MKAGNYSDVYSIAYNTEVSPRKGKRKRNKDNKRMQASLRKFHVHMAGRHDKWSDKARMWFVWHESTLERGMVSE